jgi:hypothetical protein
MNMFINISRVVSLNSFFVQDVSWLTLCLQKISILTPIFYGECYNIIFIICNLLNYIKISIHVTVFLYKLFVLWCQDIFPCQYGWLLFSKTERPFLVTLHEKLTTCS